MNPTPRIRIHRAVLIKGLIASSVMIVLFFAGADISLVALGAASFILITRRVKPQKIYGEIDWELLTLFAGLFVVIAGVEKNGLSARAFALVGVERLRSLPFLAGTVAVLSNLVSNVPAVMLFKSLIPQLPNPKTGWLVLALASTLAGNLTLLGSIANLIVAQGARNEIRITSWEYIKLGVPLTLLTMAVGLLWLL
jgi:Na+/H+ antiporter NhaD/arsenite permease-like protein